MKMNNQQNKVDKYIESFPEAIQLRLKEIRKTILKAIPNAEETISYKMPTYKLNGKYVIYFAGWKNHISIYPIPSNLETFVQGTSRFISSGSGTIQFPHKKPLPTALIQQIVDFMVKNR